MLPLTPSKGSSKSEFVVFTARSSYASAVLGIVILSVRLSICSSVRPSIIRLFYDETEERTAEILTPHERVMNHVFRYQKRLVGDIASPLKFDHHLEKRRLRTISPYNVSTVRASEKCSIIANRKLITRFQRTIDEARTLPLTPPKGGSYSEFVVFVNKIQVQSNKVCYKVALFKNLAYSSNVVVEPFRYATVHMLAVNVSLPFNLIFRPKVTHHLQQRRILTY